MVRSWRLWVLWGILSVSVLGLLWRLIDLSVFDRTFLLKQSQARIFRVVKIPAHRGIILDRLGSPLAVSTSVAAVWINPQIFSATGAEISELADILKLSPKVIRDRAQKKASREFVYLKRAVPLPIADKIKELEIPGVFFQREYRRYYPEGEVTANTIGFTNIDDEGQEGIELGFNRWLRGDAGKQEVLKDRLGNVISLLSLLKKPQEGTNIQLSLDHRIQYLAHQTLKETVEKYHAEAGSAIVVKVDTGEILAMANQPSFDPNYRKRPDGSRYRNRAATDMFEPGSVIKPFTIAFALESGKYKPETRIDTNPGTIRIGGYTIHDDLNYGVVSLTELIQKSSNIAAAKILLSLNPEHYWQLLRAIGLGEPTDSGFPGEASGKVVQQTVWRPSVVATMAYGYGISVTPLQLAGAYSVIASGGIKRPLTLLKQDAQLVNGKRIIPEPVTKEMIKMLEAVVLKGTGTRAQVPGYRVAGKTGTAYMATVHGYLHNKYMASFVGMAPASNPKVIVVVVIKDPKNEHMGAIVAAPAFSHIMQGTLRILDIAPDI